MDLSVNYDFFKVQKAEDLPSSKIVVQDLSQYFKPISQSQEAIKYLNSRGFTLNDIKNFLTNEVKLDKNMIHNKFKDIQETF